MSINIPRKRPLSKPEPPVVTVESPTPPDEPTGCLLTVAQIAQHLQLSDRQVRRLIEEGKLKSHRLGRSVRVAERDIRAFVRKCG